MFAASRMGKTFHKAQCGCAKCITPENLVMFDTEKDALDAGYKYCWRCSDTGAQFLKEKKEATTYADLWGIKLSFCEDDGTIVVISKLDAWKLSYDGDRFLIHHKNSRKDAPLCSLPGYHLQTTKRSVKKCLKNIRQHDDYRSLNPVYDEEKAPPDTFKEYLSQKEIVTTAGSKRYQKAKRRYENDKKRSDVRRVLSILDRLQVQEYVDHARADKDPDKT